MEWLRNEYVIFALFAATVFTLYMSVVVLLRKDPMRERLKRVAPVLDAPGVGYSYEERKTPFYRFCNALLAAFQIDLDQAKQQLYLPMARAGMMASDSIVYFLFFQRCVQPVLFLAGALTLARIVWQPEMALSGKGIHAIVGLILCTAGVYGARLYLRNVTDNRKQVMDRQFPDALDLILVCVEAGLPLDAALARVCRELKRSHGVVAEELDRTRIELSVLNDRVQALQNLADRTDTGGFKTLVSSLIQTERVGSSISETLRVLADEYRTTRMLQAENRAARIPALITVPLIFFIMPAFILIILGPPMIQIHAQGGFLGREVQALTMPQR